MSAQRRIFNIGDVTWWCWFSGFPALFNTSFSAEWSRWNEILLKTSSSVYRSAFRATSPFPFWRRGAENILFQKQMLNYKCNLQEKIFYFFLSFWNLLKACILAGQSFLQRFNFLFLSKELHKKVVWVISPQLFCWVIPNYPQHLKGERYSYIININNSA